MAETHEELTDDPSLDNETVLNKLMKAMQHTREDFGAAFSAVSDGFPTCEGIGHSLAEIRKLLPEEWPGGFTRD